MPTYADHIAQEVELAYRRYIAGYPAALLRYLQDGTVIDYEALGFWSFPLLFITGYEGRTNIRIVDQRRFDETVRALYASYFDAGWCGRNELDEARVTVISASSALIDTRGSRYRGDGSLLNQWAASYWLRLLPAGWKHVAVIDTEPPRPSHGEWVKWLAAGS